MTLAGTHDAAQILHRAPHRGRVGCIAEVLTPDVRLRIFEVLVRDRWAHAIRHGFSNAGFVMWKQQDLFSATRGWTVDGVVAVLTALDADVNC